MFSEQLQKIAQDAAAKKLAENQKETDKEIGFFFAPGWQTIIKASLTAAAQGGLFQHKITAPNSCFIKLKEWAKGQGLHVYQVYDNEVWVCW